MMEAGFLTDDHPSMTLLVRAPRKPDVVTSSTLGEEIRSVDDLTKPFQADVERITRETRQNEKALKLVTIEVAVDQTKTPDCLRLSCC